MGKPQQPQAPSPTATAAAQTGSNIATAIGQQQLNAIDQVGPGGSIKYSQSGTYDYTDPSTGKKYSLPKMTQTTSLSPEQQSIYDTGMRTQGTMANLAERQAGVVSDVLASPAAKASDITRPTLQTSLGDTDYSSGVQRIEEALMGRLNTQLDRDRGQLEARLASQGIKYGSEAYNSAMDDLNRGAADHRTSALLAAGQEQNRLQQLDLNAANFGNNALQQDFANQGTMFNLGNAARNQALNENIALATGTQVQMPQFSATPQTGLAGTDIAGITQQGYQNQMAAYNQGQQQMGGLFGTLGTLGAAAMPFLFPSDERLKEDIHDTGQKVDGVPVKTWKWKGSDEKGVGVIAQELEKRHPELVDNSLPYKRVDYQGLMRLGASAQRRAA